MNTAIKMRMMTLNQMRTFSETKAEQTPEAKDQSIQDSSAASEKVQTSAFSSDLETRNNVPPIPLVAPRQKAFLNYVDFVVFRTKIRLCIKLKYILDHVV
jgi:hypothetical protein